ncbi:MAG TPA: potassium-transporting ATPase subunit KdpA, partial [Candidatus Eisenbacteria bacterium]|nr:potassium-transporting ATPase subunit KdpA [Candidatus Eisenbacteria bacterium]
MTTNDWLQLALYTIVLTLLAPPLGAFMWRVLEGKPTWLTPVLGRLERTIYRLGGVDPARET